MAEWWSIEVCHGGFSVRWQDTCSSALIDPALSDGAANSGSASHRGPRPGAGAGTMALPEPDAAAIARVTGLTPPGVREPARAGAL
jgi:hypothetical protein